MTDNKRIALVTGASAGMGKDFCRALLAEGLVVYAAARRLDRMQDLRELGAFTVATDITKDEDLRALIDTINGNHGGVDVLVNNAGYGLQGPMEETSLEQARYQFEVNLFGLGRLTQLALPRMRAKRSGRIINISSVVGKAYTPLSAWYVASKHALEGWSDCLRLELAPFGIDVVIIEPGLIRTEFIDVAQEGPMKDYPDDGPYAGIVKPFAKVNEEFSSASSGASPPRAITKLVLKAVRAKRPRTRYAGGKFARSFLVMRRWISDRAMDRVVMSMVKKP